MRPNNPNIPFNNMGWWIPAETSPEAGANAIRAAIMDLTRPVYLVGKEGRVAAATDGTAILGEDGKPPAGGLPLFAISPALHPERLGDELFKQTHGLRYAYVMGAMANGITSVRMVQEAGRAGMIGFFGAGGLSPGEVEAAAVRLQQTMGDLPFGFNLIHSPSDPALEDAVVGLYLKRGVRLVSASAYMDMTLPLILYRVKGIHRSHDGKIVCPNRVIAKISRIEVARKFFSPPPEKLLSRLMESGRISREEAFLASSVPVAEDMTAEADSGGHTDNRPALALLPTIMALRDEMSGKYRYPRPLCVGLAGGVATPDSAAAAFAMGAAYVLTGSINQGCVEAGTSDPVRRMLAEACQPDVCMAPAADMFELGVKVQVLKRGTMFPQRAARLYDLYNRYERYEEIPEKERTILERDLFRCGFQEEWRRTRAFFEKRDPVQVERAEKDPRHKMALVFRSYLGQSSGWANAGDPGRRIDYQIWCGPSIGAFNEWVRGSFLEKTENRAVVTIAMNILYWAAVATRIHWLRCQGVSLGGDAIRFTPLELSEIHRILDAAEGHHANVGLVLNSAISGQ